jgi:probable HAF family extracellular repeat protein
MGLLSVGVVALACVVSSVAVAGSATATRTAAAACSPTATILESPRKNSQETQAKAINDRGDIVGFADADGGNSAIHAILWKSGKAQGAVDLGVLPGYVSSEAYGINNKGVIFGVVYDKQDRMFPFRWENGRTTLLKGPGGRLQRVDLAQRNAINARGEIVATIIDGDTPRAVRWRADGKATFLPNLPGHKWGWAFGINDAGIVSGWSRKLPNEDGEENPVLWTKDGKVVPLKTVKGQSDGIAEQMNSSGLIVGYLGTQDEGPEKDQAVVWRSRTAEPQRLGPLRDWFIAEFVDVNNRGQATGMMGPINGQTGFRLATPIVWQTGWKDTRVLPLPAASRKANPVVVAELNDINERGAIVGNAYGLSAKAYDKLRRIDPVLWTCAFGG